MASRPTEQEPALCITLELVRAQHSGDPFAFQAATQRYLLRNKDGGFKSTELPWDAGFLCDLEAIRQPTRDPVVAQRIGETLRRFMDSVGWSKHEPALLEAVQAKRRVILTLRLAAAELFSLPWELLVLRGTGQHIGELPTVLLRYEWPQTQATLEAPSPRPEHGRILVAWSAAAGAVPASEQIEAITQAALASAYPFDPDQDVLAQVSMARLTSALSEAQRTGRLISVLHILCVLHSPDLSADLTAQRVAISPDGTHIALAFGDRRVRLFDAHHPTTPPTIFDAQSGPITQLAFGPDGTHLLSGSSDRAVHLWTRTQASPVHTFRAGGAITAVQFSPDGASLLYAADDGQAHVRRRSGERWIAIALRGHRDAIRDARFLSDGKRVLTISDDYSARLWAVDDALDPKTVWQTPGRPQHITLSQEGAYAAAAQGSDVLLWTRATGHVIPLRGHREPVVYAAFSPNSLQLVTVGNDHRALIWKATDGSQLHDIAVEPGTQRAALSHDLALLATAAEQRAQVTKIDSQSRTWTFVGHRQRIESLVFTPSGHGLLTTSADRSARLWNLTDTRDSVVLRQHLDTVTSATYGFDDSDLFTGSADRRIQRSISSDYNTYVVTDRVEQLALDGPAQRIVAAAHDGTAHIISIHGAALPIVLRSEEEDAQPPQPLSAAVFTESGDHVLTASADGTVRQWALHDDIAALRRALWDVSPFCLSALQRQQQLYESLSRANASQQFCTELMRCIGTLPDPRGPRSPLPFEQCLTSYREKMQEILRWM